MRERPWLAIVCSLVFLLPMSAAGQTCGTVQAGQELKNPPEVGAKNGVLSTMLDVRFQTFCVPEKEDEKNKGTWFTTPLKLRTYTSPNGDTVPIRKVLPEDQPRPSTDLTGPTLRVRKYTPPNRPGDRLKILLKNSLPFPNSTACNSACDASVAACKCDKATLDALIQKCASQKKPDCCCVINCTQKEPNCLHGENVTNLHFHGSHVSPQSPQDFVLLDLYPKKPAVASEPEHAAHGSRGQVAYETFQYDVAPFGSQQADGTHWYHPHKHGSVGTQVANGMAGALLIEGEFDDWLKMNKYYTQEKVLVIQSVTTSDPLFKRAVPDRQILVNGQIQPKITGAPLEIQRWRIVNATMASQNVLELTLPEGPTYRQIAMDGVRFSPVNYECQPLINFDVTSPDFKSFQCNPNPKGRPTLTIAPGNRVDFLVQLPPKETKKGTEGLRVERELVNIAGEEDSNRQLLLDRDEAMAPGPAEPALFTIVVDDGIEGNDDEPKMLKAGDPTLPTTLPPMPDYLKTIEKVAGNPVAMTFQQFLANRSSMWPYSASPLSSFKIDKKQFDPTCANVTTTMNKIYDWSGVEWTVSNATLIPHPFHIHTNPFQVFSVKNAQLKPNGRPEPFWLDTLMLPPATVSPADPPADPTSKIDITPAAIVFRQRYLQFTGEYVLHCHFLGHEDRGMMFAVQTVCPPPSPPRKYGKPGNTNGECAGDAPYTDALPDCK